MKNSTKKQKVKLARGMFQAAEQLQVCVSSTIQENF